MHFRHVLTATIRIYSSTEDAQIRYTTDGSTPDKSSHLTAHGDAIIWDEIGATTFRARAFKTGMADSLVAVKKFIVLDRCKRPDITPGGGTYAGFQHVKVYSATPGTKIFYTLDNTIPKSISSRSISSGNLIEINKHGVTILKAIASRRGFGDSQVASAKFTILPQVLTPIILPSYSTFMVSALLTISCPTDNATIYYTTNGETPTATSLTITDGGAIVIDVPGRHVVKAIATHPAMLQSEVAVKDFKILLRSPKPTLQPKPGDNESNLATINAILLICHSNFIVLFCIFNCFCLCMSGSFREVRGRP